MALNKTKLLFLVVLATFLTLPGMQPALRAQTDSLKVGQQIVQDDRLSDSAFFSNLPPLKQLIDSAKAHSPLLKRQDAQILIRELQLKETRQEWLRYISVFATSNYGVFDNFVDVNSGAVSGSTLTTGNAFRWSVGANITGTPFYDMINQPTKGKIKKLEAEQELELKRNIENELRILVIQQHSDVVLNYKLLEIANENLQSNLTQVIMGEQQFKNGDIALNDLANIKEMYYKSLINYEKSLSEFRGSYLILQEIVGFEF